MEILTRFHLTYSRTEKRPLIQIHAFTSEINWLKLPGNVKQI
jgi:hypothetical protein